MIPTASRAETLGHSLISSYSETETGLRTISFAAAQDEQGILYFGGPSLLTFDGDRWQSTSIPDSFAIRSLTFGPDRRLWAGATGDLGWFEHAANSKWVFHSLRKYLPPSDSNIGEVWGVRADESGVTFVSGSHVLRWDGAHFAIWMRASEGKFLPSEYGGKLFVSSLTTGLHELHPTGPELVIDRKDIGDAGVVWLERNGSNWLLGTSNGIFRYDGHKREQFAPELLDFLSTGRLSAARRLPDGRIAIGTLRNGLAFVRPDGTVESVLNDPHCIPSPYITSLLIGRSGELWVTTGSHILRIDIKARSAVFDSRAGLPRQAYRKIAKSRDSLFVANESGVYELRDGETQFTPVEPLRGRWGQLRGTQDGLFLSGFRGAFFWNGTEKSSLYDTRLDVNATAAVRRTSNELLIAEQKSILLRVSPEEVRPLVKNLSDSPTSLAEDIEGRLWIGTLARGLLHATPTADHPVESSADTGQYGLPKLVGSTYVRTSVNGEIMVFAKNGAWIKHRNVDRFSPVTNFPNRNTASISEITSQGHVWVAHGSERGLAPCIGRISISDREAKWEPHSVDGLVDVGSPSSVFAEPTANDETILWIGGTNALLRHVVGKNLSVIAPRPPILRAFKRNATDDDRAPIQGALPYSTEQIEFEFAAPEFSRRSLLRIETRIDGIDYDWMPLAKDSRRELTAVRDGHYTVRARVVAETGATSQETTFSFDVLPPFWRTLPFVVGVAVLLLPLGYGTYVLRVRALRRRNAELEQKVRERTEELVAANAAKTQFVANMSHDIRNPLNGIVGLAIALEDTKLAPRQREIVATLRECTTYLSSLVDDVLDFASIEAGRVELRPRAYAPAELLASIVETLKVDATASGAVLSVNADPVLPDNLIGDAGRIQQILVNFVSNALKYAGGPIELSVHAPADTPGEIEFAVKDHGPGISTEEQAKLFTKFSRLRQRQGVEEIPGTGLGLASCRLLADIMGGAVGLESQPGKGARFSLRLPMTVADEPTTAVTADLPNTAVLLVEDTDYNAWAATAVLSRLGLSCERARTGAEALELFARKRFNVVLLDRNLPDMDGTEVARRMRAMESDGLQAVLLAVTAYCTAEDRELCLRAGMDAFVGKPLTPEKLRNILIAAGRRLLAAASVQAAPEAVPAEVDTSLLAYLSDGSAESLQLQVDRFITTLDEFEAELLSAIAAKDFARMGTSAHRVLGQAKMVGGTALAAVTQDLELAARAGDGVACDSLLPRVRVEARSLREAMRRPRSAAPSA